MTACSLLSYPKQQMLMEYYQSQKDQTDGVGKDEISIGEGKDQATTNWTELQKDSMSSGASVYLFRTASKVEKSAIRHPLSESEIKSESSVRIFDAARPYKIVKCNTGEKISGKDSTNAQAVFANLKSADAFYRNFCKVAPVDSNSKRIDGFVNDLKYANNACWTGSDFHFGITDSTFFKTWTDIDIVLHEVGHAVTTYTTDFSYKRQSGALNESISDVFAIIRKHKESNTLANGEDTDWSFANIVVLGNKRYAPYRSLSDPGNAYPLDCPLAKAVGKDSQVKNMSDYKHENNPNKNNDFGGVHDYSGIPNHAFYLAAKSLQSNVNEKIGPIWWQAMQESNVNDGFKEFAHRTSTIAKTYDSNIENAVNQAWRSVEVYSSSESIKTVAPLKEESISKRYIYTSIGVVSAAALTGFFLYNNSSSSKQNN